MLHAEKKEETVRFNVKRSGKDKVESKIELKTFHSFMRELDDFSLSFIRQITTELVEMISIVQITYLYEKFPKEFDTFVWKVNEDSWIQSWDNRSVLFGIAMPFQSVTTRAFAFTNRIRIKHQVFFKIEFFECIIQLAQFQCWMVPVYVRRLWCMINCDLFCNFNSTTIFLANFFDAKSNKKKLHSFSTKCWAFVVVVCPKIVLT